MAAKIIATNRRAHHDYTVLETLEAGIELKGAEVKSLRSGKASLSDSFARVEQSEIFIYNLHIPPYAFGNIANPEPVRPRKLLLHKRQIKYLDAEVSTKHVVLVPLKIYFNDDNIVKLELSIAKGKKLYDKRESIRRRETDRELRRAMKRR